MDEGRPRSKVEKAEVTHPAYLEHQRVFAEAAENRAFGELFLSKYQLAEKMGGDNFPAFGLRPGDVETEASIVRTELREALLSEELPWLVESAHEYLNVGLPDKKERNDVGLAIAHGRDVSYQTLAFMVERNQEQLLKVEALLKERLPELTEPFREALPHLLERYVFTAEHVLLLLERLDQVAVRVVDDMSAHLERMGGSYIESRNSIFISESTVRHGERLGWTLAHEYFHLLSGRTLYKARLQFDTNPEEEDDPYNTAFTGGRVGLHFGYDNQEGKGQFKWLNEAITDRLAAEYVQSQGEKVQAAYIAEQNLLSYLCTQGKHPIDFKTFAQAYFENYDPNRKAVEGDAIPAWRKLWGEIEKNFGPRFLIKLDERIQRDGVEGVLRELEGRASF
jgi:hypothetical protein